LEKYEKNGAKASVSQETPRKEWPIVKITVGGYLKFRGFFGEGMSLEFDTEAPTLGHALEAACERCGDSLRNAVYDSATRDIKKSNLILLNGQPCTNRGKRLDAVLKDGDEIVLCTLISGG
jgi:molybdopterin converting factor small subunit